MIVAYKLFISFGVASLFMLWLNRYFNAQAVRRAMGFKYTITSWEKLFVWFDTVFSFRKKDVEASFIRAGIYNTRFAGLYLPVKVALAFLVMVAVLVFGDVLGLAEQGMRLAMAMFALVVVILLPEMVLDSLHKRRIRRIASQLPYVIDLMAVCIQTGMTIEAAIGYLGQELETFDRHLGYMMRHINARARVVGLSAALDEQMKLVPANEMRSFVYTLTQSLQYGSSIFEVLTNLSSSIREIQILELEEKVGKLSAKMSIPLILFIMFPIVILITAPGIMRLMSNG